MVYAPHLFLRSLLALMCSALLCSQRRAEECALQGGLQVCALKSCGWETTVCWALWEQGCLQIFHLAFFCCGLGQLAAGTGLCSGLDLLPEAGAGMFDLSVKRCPAVTVGNCTNVWYVESKMKCQVLTKHPCLRRLPYLQLQRPACDCLRTTAAPCRSSSTPRYAATGRQTQASGLSALALCPQKLSRS